MRCPTDPYAVHNVDPAHVLQCVHTSLDNHSNGRFFQFYRVRCPGHQPDIRVGYWVTTKRYRCAFSTASGGPACEHNFAAGRQEHQQTSVCCALSAVGAGVVEWRALLRSSNWYQYNDTSTESHRQQQCHYGMCLCLGERDRSYSLYLTCCAYVLVQARAAWLVVYIGRLLAALWHEVSAVRAAKASASPNGACTEHSIVALTAHA